VRAPRPHLSLCLSVCLSASLHHSHLGTVSSLSSPCSSQVPVSWSPVTEVLGPQLASFSASAAAERAGEERRPGPTMRGRQGALSAVLTVVLLWPRPSPSCPAPCACFVPSEVHCTFRSLPAVPAGLPAHAQRLNLGCVRAGPPWGRAVPGGALWGSGQRGVQASLGVQANFGVCVNFGVRSVWGFRLTLRLGSVWGFRPTFGGPSQFWGSSQLWGSGQFWGSVQLWGLCQFWGSGHFGGSD
jgi:hypothetical protein